MGNKQERIMQAKGKRKEVRMEGRKEARKKGMKERRKHLIEEMDKGKKEN